MFVRREGDDSVLKEYRSNSESSAASNERSPQKEGMIEGHHGMRSELTEDFAKAMTMAKERKVIALKTCYGSDARGRPPRCVEAFSVEGLESDPWRYLEQVLVNWHDSMSKGTSPVVHKENVTIAYRVTRAIGSLSSPVHSESHSVQRWIHVDAPSAAWQLATAVRRPRQSAYTSAGDRIHFSGGGGGILDKSVTPPP